MDRQDAIYQAYVKILTQELVPAMGCTEPIAIAYCSAVARSVLGHLPDRIHIEASGNIIKNVKSVVVPNTGGWKGIETAAAIGALAGDETAGLEVISNVSDEHLLEKSGYLKNTEITVSPASSNLVLDITVTAYHKKEWAKVRIAQTHTNIVWKEKNGAVLFSAPISALEDHDSDLDALNLEDIYEFADTCDLSDVQDILERQIQMNTAIAQEGLRGDYGANIGKVLLKTHANDVRTRARAKAAAGSDARMNGCDLPVVINSGSGNQGLTVSLPVIEYAQELAASKQQLYRALLLANLVTLHEKAGIGRLSAYCGAVSAGAGAAAGIAYLHGGTYDCVTHTIVNALAIASGMVCDGAKASCAAKIATAVDAGILGFEMYQQGQQFYRGEGLVSKGAESTIKNISCLGRVGMKETDQVIIRMMVGESCE